MANLKLTLSLFSNYYVEFQRQCYSAKLRIIVTFFNNYTKTSLLDSLSNLLTFLIQLTC